MVDIVVDVWTRFGVVASSVRGRGRSPPRIRYGTKKFYDSLLLQRVGTRLNLCFFAMSQMDRTLARRWPIQFIARKDSHGNFHAEFLQLFDRDRHWTMDVFPFRTSHSTISSIVPKTLPFFSSETPVTWGFVTSSFRQPMRTIVKCRRICGLR